MSLALDAIAPWYLRDYPGRQRMWVAMTGTMPASLESYRKGRAKPSAAVTQRTITFLTTRRDKLTALLSALQTHLDSIPPERNRGICSVDPVTGLDARHRGRKTKRP